MARMKSTRSLASTAETKFRSEVLALIEMVTISDGGHWRDDPVSLSGDSAWCIWSRRCVALLRWLDLGIWCCVGVGVTLSGPPGSGSEPGGSGLVRAVASCEAGFGCPGFGWWSGVC